MSNASDLEIRRAAIRLRGLVFAAMALVVLLYVAAQLNLQFVGAHVEYRGRGLDAPYEQIIGAVGLALLLLALFRLTQMLARIANGDLFSMAVIRRFRGFALWLFVMASFEIVAPAGAGVLGAAASRPHLIRLMFDLRDVLTLGITLLLFLLANLLERARRLDEEMREFV